jgi:hypothetical protein
MKNYFRGSYMKEKSENAALKGSNNFVFVETAVVRVDDVQMYAGVEV